MTCSWCYSVAEWLAHTPRHDDGVTLCQSHYDGVQREMRADRLARLDGDALALVHEAWARA